MLPAAYLAGGVDRIELESAPGPAQSIAQAVREAAAIAATW